MRPTAALLTVLLAALAAPRDAAAFTYDSPVSDGCHEAIAASALRAVRAQGLAPPLASTTEEEALIADVPFALPEGMGDLGGATLMLAVRDNDLKGRHPTDTDQLALVHGDPLLQREHCLRLPSHDEPGGTQAALADCKAFIRTASLDALQGLDEHGSPDPANRVSVPVHLAIRGEAFPTLPRFYVKMGTALHTLGDAFTHTLRSSDGLRVRVVLNWIDYVNDDLDEARDGPAHMRELDRCDDPDDLRKRRRELATGASRELLAATLDPALDAAQKEGAIDAVLARYLGYEGGCTAANRWCDAPELAYRDATCACRAAGAGAPPTGALSALATGLAALRLRRRRRA